MAALLGTISALAVPNYLQTLRKSALKGSVGDLASLQFEIDMYERMNERLPDTLDDLEGGPRIDRWGRPFQYLPSTAESWQTEHRRDEHQKPLNSDYDLFSGGPNGRWNKPLNGKWSRDDVVRAEDGFYIGPASDY